MKTIICDIDGTIFKYVRNHHYDLVHTEAQLLPGVLDKFKAWEEKGCRIILLTGRRESVRDITENASPKILIGRVLISRKHHVFVFSGMYACVLSYTDTGWVTIMFCFLYGIPSKIFAT